MWHEGTLAGWDLETTGVQVESDRVVQAALVIVDVPNKYSTADVQLINPGVPVPEAASAVHGLSTEKVQAEGGAPAEVLEHYADELFATMAAGLPVVTMNGSYDFTLFDRELRRHNLKTVEERLRRPIGPVIDVRVLDKLCHPYRKGGRKLTDLCEHYGARHDGAHDAGADALAACRIAWQMCEWGSKPLEFFQAKPAISPRDVRKVAASYRRLTELTLEELHAVQVKAKREQDASFAAYKKSRGEECDADGHWPMRPYAAAEVPA